MSRSVSVDCPSCGAVIRVRSEALGTRGRCPHCRDVVTLPAEAAMEPEFDDSEFDMGDREARRYTPRREPAPERSSARTPIVLAAVVGSLLFAAIVASVIAVVMWKRAAPQGVANDNPLADRGVASAAAPPSAASAGEITDEECLKFAQAIEEDVVNGDAATLDAKINWNDMIARATDGTGAPENIRRQFSDTILRTMQLHAFATPLIQQPALGGGYDFLRIIDDKSGKRLLFRLLLGSGGVNYHELYLARRPDSSLEIVDIYVFLTGELMSTTIRRGFLPVAASATRGVLDKLSGAEQDLVRHGSTISAMVNMQRAGRYAEVISSYHTLSPSLKRNKNVLMVTLQAAQLSENHGEYAQILETFRNSYPDDACVDFLSIDFYLLRKQYDESLACIDRVEKWVGGDPYMGVMRSGVHFMAGDKAKAIAEARKTVEGDPTLSAGYVNLGNLYLDSKEFGKFLELSDAHEAQFGAPIELEQDHPNVQALTASAEYKAHQEKSKASP